MSRRKLTSMAMDAFRELGNIGSGHASAALATMIHHKVDITVPKVTFVPLANLADYSDPSQPVVAVHLGVEGDVHGVVTLSIPQDQAVQLIRLVTGMDIPADGEMGASVVSEVANIISGAFLNALNGMTGLTAMVTPPQFCAGEFHDAFGEVVSQLSRWGDHTFICETAFVNESRVIQSNLLFMPSSDQLEMILRRMGLPDVFEAEVTS